MELKECIKVENVEYGAWQEVDTYYAMVTTVTAIASPFYHRGNIRLCVRSPSSVLNCPTNRAEIFSPLCTSRNLVYKVRSADGWIIDSMIPPFFSSTPNKSVATFIPNKQRLEAPVILNAGAQLASLAQLKLAKEMTLNLPSFN